MGKAADLVALKIDRLDPLWTAYIAGAFLVPIPGVRLGGFTDTSSDSAELYVRNGGQWFEAAVGELQVTAPGLEADTLAVAIDEVVKRRSELMGRGFGKKSVLGAAADGFTAEFTGRLEALGYQVSKYTPSPRAAWGLALVAVLVLILIVVPGRR